MSEHICNVHCGDNTHTTIMWSPTDNIDGVRNLLLHKQVEWWEAGRIGTITRIELASTEAGPIPLLRGFIRERAPSPDEARQMKPYLVWITFN